MNLFNLDFKVLTTFYLLDFLNYLFKIKIKEVFGVQIGFTD